MNKEPQSSDLHQPNSTPNDLSQEEAHLAPIYHGLNSSPQEGTQKTNQGFLLYRNQVPRQNVNTSATKNEKNSKKNFVIESPQLNVKSVPHDPKTDADSPTKTLNGFESFGKQYHGGSLENLYQEVKKENSKEIPQTFGDDQFNSIMNQQLADSPSNAQPKSSKIERMLQEHKNKKILQKIFYVQKEPQTSPGLALNSSEKSSSKLSYDVLHKEYAISEGDFRTPLDPEPTFGTRSHPKFEGVHQHGGQEPGHIVYSYENTGRFGGAFIPYGYEFGDDIESFKDSEERSLNNARPQFERKSSASSSKRVSGNNSPSGKNGKNIPKISENSHRIMKNSQKAKEDEEIIQELITVNALKASKNMSNNEGKDLLQLQNIPEENEDLYQFSGNKLGAKAKMTLQQKLQKAYGSNPTKGSSDSINISNSYAQSPNNKSASKPIASKNSPNEGRALLKASLNSPDRSTPNNQKTPAKQNLDTSKVTNLNDSTSTGKNWGRNSPISQKKSPLRKPTQEVDVNDVSTNPSLYSSPQKNVLSATIVEHKKRSHLENIKAANRLRKGRVSVSPTQKEIKEIANMAKNIYLRVVHADKPEIDDTDSTPKSNFKRSVNKAIKNHPIVKASEFIKKLAERPQKVDLSFLTPEELKVYDEVQRLEIMLQNLRQIQQANLMYNEKNSNSTKALPKQDWDQYADNINGDAKERRTIRKKREEDKLPKARSLSPVPMEKVDPTLESLIESMQMRQKLYPRRETEEDAEEFQGMFKTEDGQIKAWEEMDMYERNIVWLLARNDKLQKMNSAQLEDEMRPCSFKPTIYTKNFNPAIQSAKLKEQSPYIFNTLSDRNHLERNESEGVNNTTGYLKDRSLYKDRKAIENYTELFGLKKTYNLYKSEIFVPRKTESISTKNDKSVENMKFIPTEI